MQILCTLPPHIDWDCFYFITGIQYRFLGITHPTAIAQTDTTNMPRFAAKTEPQSWRKA